MCRFFEKVKCFFIRPYDTPVCWFPIFLTFATFVGLLIIEHYFAATLLFFVCSSTVAIVIREDIFRRTEIFRKVHDALDDLNIAKILCKDWTDVNFPNLYCPMSPCVTLQWTYRDKRIVNLPWALLVKGDHIIIRPGQVAPGLCNEINGKRKFIGGETYGLSQVKNVLLCS